MWLLRLAFRRPIPIIGSVVAVALSSILAVRRTRIDFFPTLDLPVIYVAQPYGGMSPQQMEGFISYYYEYHFLYINGIESVEAKSIQGTALLRLSFHPGTNMSEALAQTVSYVNRAHAFMPPGTVSPFVIRFDAGTLPVGYLVFSSPSRTLSELQDLALNRVRPVFATLPGVSSPPPFGGNQRTIVINVDPQKLHAYGLSPDNVVQALTTGNSIQPAGNIDIGTTNAFVTTDSTVTQINDLLDIPLHPGSGASIYVRDVGSVKDTSDVLAGYALLNGQRTIYIPVTKRPDASTITVVNEVRQNIERFQSLIPQDIKITYEFDQSQYVRASLLSVLREGLIGAGLTGLMVLLFLGDWRSSLIVVITIPFALLTAVGLVRVLANWILKQEENEAEHPKEERFDRLRKRFQSVLERIMAFPKLLLGAYALVAVLIIVLIGPRLAEEIFPSSASTQFRLRIDAPDGTRVAVTEALVQKVLATVSREAGAGKLDLTLGYFGTQTSSYPINTVFLWTSGSQQAIMNVGLNPEAKISLRSLEENLRQKLPQEFPGTHFSFDPGDLISQTLNFGAPSSAEVAITGPQYADVQNYANRVQQELAKVKELRDVEFEEPLRYPTVNVQVNRVLAGQLGATANDVGAAIVTATASSRFVAPNYWRDPKSGVSYQVQVQVPQPAMTSLKDIQTIPVNSNTGTHPLLSQVADIQSSTVPGELDRQNGMWMIIASANVGNSDFSQAAKEIDRAIAKAGQAPRGVTTQVRGQVSALKQIFTELAIGLALAVVVILLLLTANFQSFRLALIVISSAPAVPDGAILMLLLTGTTLNLESFMGTSMAMGVAVANAILLVSFAEQNRRNGADPVSAARAAAAERLRPVLMTSLAMIAGMIPMALAIGRGSEETAPLGRAVIGGFIPAPLATVFLLPTAFGILQKGASLTSPSLDPEDADSPFAQKPENA